MKKILLLFFLINALYGLGVTGSTTKDVDWGDTTTTIWTFGITNIGNGGEYFTANIGSYVNEYENSIWISLNPDSIVLADTIYNSSQLPIYIKNSQLVDTSITIILTVGEPLPEGEPIGSQVKIVTGRTINSSFNIDHYSPVVNITADTQGIYKSEFSENDTIYGYLNEGMIPNRKYDLFVVPHKTQWNDGDTLENIAQNTEELIFANTSGGLSKGSYIWKNCTSLKLYDLIIDRNKNNRFDFKGDLIDPNFGKADSVHPDIVSFLPDSNTYVLNDDTVIVQFSQDMDLSSIDTNTFRIVGSRRGLYTGSYNYNSSSKTIKFIPDNEYQNSEKITVTLSDSIKSTINNSLYNFNLNIFSWTFTVNPNIYVDLQNNDFEDGSFDHPFNSIQEALEASLDSTTVTVFEGNYSADTLTIDKYITLVGQVGDSINISANWCFFYSFKKIDNISFVDGEIRLFDTKKQEITNSTFYDWLYIKGPDKVDSLIIENCKFFGNGSITVKNINILIKDCQFNVTGSAIGIEPDGKCEITGCEFEAEDYGVSIFNRSTAKINLHHNVFHDCFRGVYSYYGNGTNSWNISRNTFYNNKTAIAISYKGPLIENNCIINNEIGIDEPYEAAGSWFTVRSNIICFNDVGIWNNNIASETYFYNNCLFGNSEHHPNIEAVLDLYNNISENPELEDTASLNFQLKYSSPCIDKGSNNYLIADDSGVFGWENDIGVFEYSGNRVCQTITESGDYYFGGKTKAQIHINNLDDTSSIDITVYPSENKSGILNSVNRWYRIISDGNISNYNLKLSYEDSELNEISEDSLKIWRLSGGEWFGPYIPDTLDQLNNVITVNNLDGFSDFIISDQFSETALPIFLGEFTAIYSKGHVKLKWQTASETNNSRFVIYRNDEAYISIEGAGTTSEPRSYSYVDNSVIPGASYTYILADVSYANEETKYTDKAVTVVIPENDIPQEFALDANYPNPFNPITTISFQLSAVSDVEFSIYDMRGKKVATLINDNKPAGYYELNWDASDFSSGIYFFRLQAGDFIVTKKMILMK